MDETQRPEDPAPQPAAPEATSGEPGVDRDPPREEAGPAPDIPAEAADAVRTGGSADAEPDAGSAESDGPPDGDGQPRRRRRRRRRRTGEAGEATEAAEAGATNDTADVSDPPHRNGSAESGGAPRSDEAGRPAKTGKRQRKAKRPKPKPGADRADRADLGRPSRSRPHDATGAVKTLSDIARNLLDAEGIDAFGRPRFLDVQLRIPLDADRDAVQAAELLVSQILGRVQAVREHEAALRPGAVYCFYSNRADQRASRPAGFREIFEGFSSTGRPRFSDFVTLAIERRDEGVERLVEGEDLIVTHVSMGRLLRTQQLQEFGNESPIYRILGQVDAGLFEMMNSDQKAAFSFQLLLGHTLEGRARYRLHWVGAANIRDVADPGVGQILRRFQQKLDHHALRYAGLEARGQTPDEEEFVLPVLQELAKRLAGRVRRAGRRTDHAQERTEQSQRPTTKAWEDAGAAADDRVLRDTEEDTLVVAGPRNRCHVFTADARHVTSFVMTARNVQRRQQEGRWVPAEPEERGEFRIALRRRLAGQVEDEEGGAEGG